ncbi:MAG: hypothetical protein J6N72_08135 [Psychrobacter sp.]|nr:hypothetical protein [Psychrobacter sp.]
MSQVLDQQVDLDNLPSKVTIYGVEYALFDNNKDPLRNSVDLVKCNYCSKYGYVERCADDCPDCKASGFLADGFEDDIKAAAE